MSYYRFRKAEKDEIKVFLENHSFNIDGEFFTVESLKSLVAYAIKLVFEKYRDDSHISAGNNAGIFTSFAAAVPTGGLSLIVTPFFYHYSSKHEKLRSPYVFEIKNLQSVYEELSSYDKEIKIFNIHQQKISLVNDLQISNESIEILNNSSGFTKSCSAFNTHYEIGSLRYTKQSVNSPNKTPEFSALGTAANISSIVQGLNVILGSDNK